jgi:alpha-D-ribose 1-methylphosphonate 5-phosphate C-P lyase
MGDRRLSVLPLGDLHDEGICARCGARGTYPELMRTVLASTHARAVVCSDTVACLRRRRKAQG